MYVWDGIPEPYKYILVMIVPDETAETVKVVPEIDPVNTAVVGPVRPTVAALVLK